MCEKFHNLIKNLWNFVKTKPESITALATIVMTWVIYMQLAQLNELKRFENFNYFNEIYAKWYDDMPSCLNEKDYNIVIMPGINAPVLEQRKIYVEKSSEGYLLYTVLTPEGSKVNGKLSIHVNEELTQKILNDLRSQILKETSVMGHTQEKATCEPWDRLSNDDKGWVRRYFNLYAQEFYFYNNHKIPDEMWDKLIHGSNGCNGAAIVNLREFPILLEGYEVWKEKGDFQFPDGFTDMLDKKIKECRISKNKSDPG